MSLTIFSESKIDKELLLSTCVSMMMNKYFSYI